MGHPRRKIDIVGLGLTLGLFAAPAFADEAGVLRLLCTDCPTKSTSPCTVDAGHFQLETDLFNLIVDHTGGGDVKTYLFTNPTLKYGLTGTLDAEINMVPLAVITARDRQTGATSRTSGVGDLFLKLKWNLLGNAGGSVGFGLSPYVKLPTASGGVGNGAVETGLIAPANINLPRHWSVTLDPEIDLLKNAGDGGRHVNLAGLISVSRGVSKTLTLSAELWADRNVDPQGAQTQVSADLGAAYIPAKAPNLQFDGGVNFGLNRNTPGTQVYVGVSRRF